MPDEKGRETLRAEGRRMPQRQVVYDEGRVEMHHRLGKVMLRVGV